MLDMRDAIGAFDDGSAVGPGACHVPFANAEVVADIGARLGKDEICHFVLAQVGMQHGCLRTGAKLGVKDPRQRFVFHFDQIDRLLGNLFADRRHASHRVAHVAHPVAAKDMAVLQIQPDQTRKIFPGDNGFNARQSTRLAGIDALDQGMRMRAALDARIHQSGAELQVVGE